jgi:hypothetical protein
VSTRPITIQERGARRMLDFFARVQHGARGTFKRTGQMDLLDNAPAPEPMPLAAVGQPMDVLGLAEQRERGVLVVRALLECGHRPVVAFGGLPVEAPPAMPCRECDAAEWSGT